MNIQIPVVLWQVLTLFLIVPAILFGLYLRLLRQVRIKRKELLQALHTEGEAEVIREGSADVFLSFMEEIAASLAVRELIEEGVVSEHVHRVVQSNRWKEWRVYRLVVPKGVELTETLFGSSPKSPPE